MAFDSRNHHRRSIRLPERDYSQSNAYFVTVCVAGKQCVLADVKNGQLQLSSKGTMAAEEWTRLGKRFDAVWLDAWVVMPNHLHGIVWLRDSPPIHEGAQQRAPTHPEPLQRSSGRRKPLGQIIGAFKTAVMRRINELDGTPGQTIWQRNFHERVIRDERELQRIRRYIRANPKEWLQDPENPVNQQSSPRP